MSLSIRNRSSFPPLHALLPPAMFDFWDQLGVFIFAVSGALAGREKGMDYFGMFVVGLITGTGGGTLRSILIGDTPPAILQNPNYILIAIGATIFAFVGAPIWRRIKGIKYGDDAFDAPPRFPAPTKMTGCKCSRPKTSRIASINSETG